ncbi:ATP-binding protein [Streptomyces sp. NPDC101225]|uniref:sensor histidine kinase n=1 Tax=Streptomyces sp. NPDC101225 TaxID=3366135 RepID=UPI00381A772E
MSHLRAPAARADRREGGRHGRPVARPVPSLPETHIRPQLMRLAVLPPIAVALSAAAAVLFTVRSTGARPGPTLWGVMAGAAAVTLAGILIAVVAADRAARAVSDRVGALRRGSARGEADLRALVEALRRGEAPPQRKQRSGPPDGADDFELLAADLTRARDGAVTAVMKAAQLSSQAGSEQKLEVFVNLARRLQSLVHREISILDELENEIEDPDLLKGLFHVDHLATRIRRHAENLAVLGGAVSRRQWSHPVTMTEVLRSAIAEVEQYSRVKLVPPIDGTLRGHAVADVIHLLAELVENASVFSAPHTQVLLRANLVTSGLAVEVEDRGLGMPVEEQKKMNTLLADPDQVNVASLLADGRIGLFVVSQLARRHGINVRLQTNIYGGVQAVLVVPQALLGSGPGGPADAVPQTHGGMGAVGAVGTTGAPGLSAPSSAVPGLSAPPTAAPPPAPSPQAQSRAQAPSPPHAHAQPPVHGQPQPSPHPLAPSGSAPVSEPAGPHVGPEPRPSRRARQREGPRAAAEGPRPAAATPHGHHLNGTPVNGSSPGAGGPLPVRGTREDRANPAEALPGIRPDERRRVAENTAEAPEPRVGTVRGTMGKPRLPRRRAQEHIVPQLREGPAPRQDTDHPAGHDPGLMAAFQRGIGLAEAQQNLESEHTGGLHIVPDHTAPAGHRDPEPGEPTAHAGPHPLRDPARTESSARLSHPALDAHRAGATSLHTPHPLDVNPMDPSHIAEARPASARVTDHPTRHDGSAPAG